MNLWDKVVFKVETYVDRLEAWKSPTFSLFITSQEFLIDRKDFYRTFQRLFHSIKLHDFW